MIKESSFFCNAFDREPHWHPNYQFELELSLFINECLIMINVHFQGTMMRLPLLPIEMLSIFQICVFHFNVMAKNWTCVSMNVLQHTEWLELNLKCRSDVTGISSKNGMQMDVHLSNVSRDMHIASHLNYSITHIICCIAMAPWVCHKTPCQQCVSKG